MSQVWAGGAPKRILVFCRFYLVDDFRKNLEPFSADPRFEFSFLTDGQSRGTRDTRARFYRAFKAAEKAAELNRDDIEEIVSRCRYLREIDRDQAERQVHAMAIAIGEAMQENDPDAVLSHMVDDYTTHVCAVLAEKRNIRFVGYAFSYFPGRVQLTQGWAGEAFDIIEPDARLLGQIFDQINQRVYRQNYLQEGSYSRVVHWRMVARYFVKRAAFTAKRFLERDPLNLHYTITPYVADRKRISDFPKLSKFDEDWRDKVEALAGRESGAKIIYMPLAFNPESTIDYWIQDKRPINYESLMLTVLDQLTKSAIVIVKEHVHMQGIRAPSFYEKLGSMGRVINVPPEHFSNDVLERCDAVLIGGGSVGIEATIRGKPVASYAPHSYWFEASNAAELSFDTLAEWPEQIDHYIEKFQPLEHQAKMDFIRKCLSSTVEPRGGQKIWPLIAEEDLERILLSA